MVRPRLVQKGVPLYGPGSEVVHQQDGNISDHSMDDGHPAEAIEETANSNRTVVSSLQRAAATTSSDGRRKRSNGNNKQRATTYVIGGGTTAAPAATPRTEASDPVIPPGSYPQIGQWSDTMTSSSAPPIHHHHHINATNMTPEFIPHNRLDLHNDHQVSSMTMEAEHIAPHQQAYHIPNPHHHYMTHPPNTVQPAGIQNRNYEMGPQPTSTTRIQSSHVIGGENALPAHSLNVEKMEGVQDHGSKMPLVVLDGANVAHAYTNAMANMNATYRQKRNQYRNGKSDPDARGIQVAADYFLSAGIRVLIVLPQYWLRKKPRAGDTSSQNAMMETTHLDILNRLDDKGLIVSSPPADDDDAYALTIAKREETRALRQRNGEGPGFVLSNDMFRDAQARDPTGILEKWLNNGRDESIGPGRISYTFCDMGTMDDHGDRILDFVPNPRHSFVIFVEGLHHQALVNR